MAGSPNLNTRGPRGGIIQGINVTPLVDILLVLLVIFMVTAQFTSPQAIPLNLPQSSESDTMQMVFSVTVPEDGPLQVDGETVAAGDLPELAKKALEDDPKLRAVIQADGDVPHRRVISVMDALREGGLSRVAFTTTPSPDSPEEG